MVEFRRVDSPVGTWDQAHWTPAQGDVLAGLVDSIWDFDGTLVHRREQIFPNGLIELVAQLDEPHRPVQPEGEPFPALCVDGLRTSPTTIEGPRDRCRVLGIRLRPIGAFAMLRASLRDLTNQSADLQLVLGGAAEELGQRLSSARDGSQRIRTAERWIRARMLGARAVDPIVASAVQMIDRNGGNVVVTRLDDLNGRSRSRFSAAFRDQVGLTPKLYARIVRFRQALALFDAEQSIGSVAAAAGYYDQAHMTAEFGELAGLTPSAYLGAKRYPGSSHLMAPC
jgi:AraC-like DNA-binding protein